MVAEALEPSALLQEYVPPPVAVTLMLFTEQVSTVVPELLVMPAVGGVLSCVTVIEEVAVQPLAAVSITL